MFKSFDEAKKYIENEAFEAVDLKFCDLWGRWHHLTVPVEQFTPEIMEAGIGFDGSSVGLKTVKSGDMIMTPDLGSAFQDPFWEQKTLSFFLHYPGCRNERSFCQRSAQFSPPSRRLSAINGDCQREPLGT